MKKIRYILIFCIVWFLSAFILSFMLSLFLLGKAPLPDWFSYFLLVFSSVCGILACRSWPTNYRHAKKVTPRMLRDAERLLPRTKPFTVNLLQEKLASKEPPSRLNWRTSWKKEGLSSSSRTPSGRLLGTSRDLRWSECLPSTAWMGSHLRTGALMSCEKTAFPMLRSRRMAGCKASMFSPKRTEGSTPCSAASSPCDLGGGPVQKVHAGKGIYHCQIGAVMTNRRFTQGAKDAAKETSVLLWDRDAVGEMASAAGLF